MAMVTGAHTASPLPPPPIAPVEVSTAAGMAAADMMAETAGLGAPMMACQPSLAVTVEGMHGCMREALAPTAVAPVAEIAPGQVLCRIFVCQSVQKMPQTIKIEAVFCRSPSELQLPCCDLSTRSQCAEKKHSLGCTLYTSKLRAKPILTTARSTLQV